MLERLPWYQVFSQDHRCYKLFGVLHSIHTRYRGTKEKKELNHVPRT